MKERSVTIPQYGKVRRRARVTSLVMLCGLCLASTPLLGGIADVTFTTDLKKVKSLQVDGEEFLTIEIGSRVGPWSCRGTTLRVALESQPQDHMETIALSAMLSADPVMITVPMSAEDCIGGMPTVVDMYLLEGI